MSEKPTTGEPATAQDELRPWRRRQFLGGVLAIRTGQRIEWDAVTETIRGPVEVATQVDRSEREF